MVQAGCSTGTVTWGLGYLPHWGSLPDQIPWWQVREALGAGWRQYSGPHEYSATLPSGNLSSPLPCSSCLTPAALRNRSSGSFWRRAPTKKLSFTNTCTDPWGMLSGASHSITNHIIKSLYKYSAGIFNLWHNYTSNSKCTVLLGCVVTKLIDFHSGSNVWDHEIILFHETE